MISNTYILSQAKLDELVERIAAKKIFALDTEFTRQTTYYPILSIIQVALKNPENRKEVFIIDCLSSLNLSGFFQLMANPEIIKILHSSTQDLQIFHQKSNLIPQRIFDTQLMANFCGFGCSVGYSVLVEKIFNQHLDKKQQRSDWQKRPLSVKQLEYAALDVVFLEEIYEKFLALLHSRNALNWYLEEEQSFLKKTISLSDENLIKKISLRNKTSKEISQIKSLLTWRENWARKVDVPRRHFLEDEIIEKFVAGNLTNPNFSRNFTPEIFAQMHDVIAQNSQNSEVELDEEKIFMTQKQKDCFEKAKEIISKIAAQENFADQFLITSADLKKVICDKNSFDKKVTGWRQQMFGTQLQELILNF